MCFVLNMFGERVIDHLRETCLPAEWKTDGRRVRKKAEKSAGMCCNNPRKTDDGLTLKH